MRDPQQRRHRRSVDGMSIAAAYGIAARAFDGDIAIQNSGDVTATSQGYYRRAVGISAETFYGDISIVNSGEVTSSYYAIATQQHFRRYRISRTAERLRPVSTASMPRRSTATSTSSTAATSTPGAWHSCAARATPVLTAHTARSGSPIAARSPLARSASSPPPSLTRRADAALLRRWSQRHDRQ